MTKVKIDLSELINEPQVNTISGRAFGEAFAKKYSILELVRDGNTFEIIIDDSKIKAINDSFLKGFFSSVFKELGTKTAVSSVFEIDANDYYKRLIDKNWSILDAINNS